jgi:hypothetical protein
MGGGRWTLRSAGRQPPAASRQPPAASRQPLECPYAEADLLLEADLNHVQERQRSSGRARDRSRGAGHQPDAAVARVSRRARRRGELPRVRQPAQPRVQGARAARVEAGGHRADARATEPDQTANPRAEESRDLRVRQKGVRRTGAVGAGCQPGLKARLHKRRGPRWGAGRQVVVSMWGRLKSRLHK